MLRCQGACTGSAACETGTGAQRTSSPFRPPSGDASLPELEEICDTERHLLNVACTRACDHLLVTGVEPSSEFLGDLRTSQDVDEADPPKVSRSATHMLPGLQVVWW